MAHELARCSINATMAAKMLRSEARSVQPSHLVTGLLAWRLFSNRALLVAQCPHATGFPRGLTAFRRTALWVGRLARLAGPNPTGRSGPLTASLGRRRALRLFDSTVSALGGLAALGRLMLADCLPSAAA